MAKRKNVIGDKEQEFLKNYLSVMSPTGFEAEGQKTWLEYMKPCIDEHFEDNYGSVAGIINPGKDFKVVIEAHADEISWFVNYISEDGFLYVKRNGGSDHQIAPSKRVNIMTANGIVKGVFGWPAIHMRKGDKNDTVPKPENIFVDVGCHSKEEVQELGINPGCVLTYEDEMTVLNNRYYTGRALDNRIGGFMIAQVARLLKENRKKKRLPFSLYIVNAVQEEVGARGAQMITETIQPDMVLVTDVCHDTTTPMIDKKSEGEFAAGKGPALTIGPAIHNKLLDWLIETAKKEDIPFQHGAEGRNTGTDTDNFAFSNGGVPSALISLPLRYMHTTVESIAIDDVEQTINLMYQAVVNFKTDFNFKFIE